MELKNHCLEAMLKGEMTSPLEYAPPDPAGTGYARNGYSAKKGHS